VVRKCRIDTGEIACAFFLLLAFHLFLRDVDTNRRGYWVATRIVFITIDSATLSGANEVGATRDLGLVFGTFTIK